MKLFLAADHRGYDRKEQLKSYLESMSISFEDVSSLEKNPSDDYPIVAQTVAQKVLSFQPSYGVVLCGSGAGVDIVSNKINGIRCVLALNADQVRASRQDDNVNMLAIAADYTSLEDAKQLVDAFISTPYEPSEKHERRLAEIDRIESQQ